ncbi:MAG: hypothetical protein RIQ79_364 [Verrucomicrobiota bacterium]|jgi:hypothetical protein
MFSRVMLSAVFFAMVCSGLCAAKVRTWTDVDGRTVEAELIRTDSAGVVIRRGDGREFTLARTRLSAGDIEYLSAQAGPGGGANDAAASWVAAVNEALGLELFADGSLWDDEPAAVAARLRLRPESVTSGAESWRYYASPAVTVLGVPAYMLALRSEDGRLADFTVMFTNRGDFPAFARRGRRAEISKAEIAEFGAVMLRDFSSARKALVAAMPGAELALTPALRREYPGELAVFGAGDHVLVLQVLSEQMLTLRVRPSTRSAASRLSDDQLRQRLKARVTRRENGDVVIDQIPMVNQGPKGYCVPATFERMLRYAGIPADMYELAAQGGTGFGGGTNVDELVDALGRTVRQAGRRLESFRVEPAPAALAKYIDEGRPVLWSLASTPEFNEFANTYSDSRPEATAALKEWAALRKSPSAGLSRDPQASHLCLLIGYNRTTGELAFSDSWGPRFAERWVPAVAVQQVSFGRFWVLGF